MKQVRVYLAGPEVFLPNAREQLDAKIELTRAAGLIPVSPGDLEIPQTPTKKQKGHTISGIDEQLMRSADAIIANLTPFRGISADTGTCYELGFMCALGKAAYAYTNMSADHHARAVAHYAGHVAPDAHGRLRGSDGMAVEDFDMIDNLMMHGGIERRGGVVVVGNAPVGALYTDLTAFKEVLAIAAARLLA
ncbi:MAG: nucleoside 2-deoxyribosyltransferase [Devosia sp.]|nr:nucleoside 2-deoxyribosyltransferase [Devosia sp.]